MFPGSSRKEVDPVVVEERYNTVVLTMPMQIKGYWNPIYYTHDAGLNLFYRKIMEDLKKQQFEVHGELGNFAIVPDGLHTGTVIIKFFNGPYSYGADEEIKKYSAYEIKNLAQKLMESIEQIKDDDRKPLSDRVGNRVYTKIPRVDYHFRNKKGEILEEEPVGRL
jgi:hypothetical protein